MARAYAGRNIVGVQLAGGVGIRSIDRAVATKKYCADANQDTALPLDPAFQRLVALFYNADGGLWKEGVGLVAEMITATQKYASTLDSKNQDEANASMRRYCQVLRAVMFNAVLTGDAKYALSIQVIC